MTTPPPLITDAERQTRLQALRRNMDAAGLDGVLLGSTESLRYFTGLVWHQSERLLGALVTPTTLTYVVPAFEQSRVETLPHLEGKIVVWQEEEDPAALVASLLGPRGRLALDDALPLFAYHALAGVLGAERLADGGRLIRDLRLAKSPAEIALITYAMGLTLEVQRRTHAIMRPGIRASEVVRYIDEQHRELGADGGSTFCIVSFGAATALPHGADGDQTLAAGDVILVDTGTRIDGYHSDLTRTYVLDEPDVDFARAWAIERAAQQAVFDAARLGAPCHSLDDAARAVIAGHGLGPDYRLPGLPHRAGHGLGLEIHEEPYLVRGNATTLATGMCFSNEPMIVFPGRYGIRLEDHIHMTASGPEWFTTPARGPAEPFG
ncbi:Xaa-Pro peptidase family protein [Rhizobium sp. TRM96647]|uniref:M24 family metallopeptidase n=1 Tax=unclassified Rhizobium TaxID=2613769 RepID=UPI0021E9296A|nr:MULTISPECIES: Xaa-Pro peptidase family protein [unclassified Rhizobium]MCV3738755.1 Xaa-Pro peptidase family protein [Rhizobium sp. TRM96647]MCV3760538.1 Xaa-Pro peptidase family protein [Rhizobium sp. TRM96650]